MHAPLPNQSPDPRPTPAPVRPLTVLKWTYVPDTYPKPLQLHQCRAIGTCPVARAPLLVVTTPMPLPGEAGKLEVFHQIGRPKDIRRPSSLWLSAPVAGPFQLTYAMRLFTVAAALCFATPAFLQETYDLWYDTIYDQRDTSLSSVTCSTGRYGLLTRGYQTFGDLPTSPFIGGAPQIQSWNSPNCGTCWELTYIDPNGVPWSLSFTAINRAAQGTFTIFIEAMNRLTSGNAQALDGVSITATQLAASACGL